MTSTHERKPRYTGKVNPAEFGAVYGTGLSAGVYTNNSTAYELAQQKALATGAAISLTGKLGLIRSPRQRNCPVIAEIPFQWDFVSFETSPGCALFDGGVPDNTTFYRHGEFDQRYTLMNAWIIGVGLYSANPKVIVMEVRGNTVSTSSAGGLAIYTNRTMKLDTVTVVHAGQGIQWGPHTWRNAAFNAWTANRFYSMHDHIDSGGRAYKCIGSGCSGSAAPAFPTTEFATVTDGSTRVARANLTAYAIGDVRSSADGLRALICVKAGTTAAAEPGGVAATARANSTAYQLGDIRTNAAGDKWYRCTTAGTTAAAEPGALGTAALGDFVTDGVVAGTVSNVVWLRIIPRNQFVYDGTVKWHIQDWAVWEDRGPSSAATVPLRANSTAYVAGNYIRVDRTRWLCTVSGTSAASQPAGYRGTTRAGQPFGTTRGDVVVDGTATFVQNGEAFIDSWEEQCDGPEISNLNTYGSGGLQTAAFVCSGANAGDGATVHQAQANNGCQNGEAMVLLNGGNWIIATWYGGGDGTGTKIFTRNLNNIPLDWGFCQSEKFQATFEVPHNAPQAMTHPITFRFGQFDDDVHIFNPRRVYLEGSTLGGVSAAGEAAKLRLVQGSRVYGVDNNFGNSDRAVTSLNDTFGLIQLDLGQSDGGSLVNGIWPQNARVWAIGNWAVGSPTFRAATTEGRTNATTRANTTAYAIGAVAKNAAGTFAFVCKIAGTSAAAEPGAMAAPTVGLDYVDGTVLWSCVNTVAVLTNGGVL